MAWLTEGVPTLTSSRSLLFAMDGVSAKRKNNFSLSPREWSNRMLYASREPGLDQVLTKSVTPVVLGSGLVQSGAGPGMSGCGKAFHTCLSGAAVQVRRYVSATWLRVAAWG